MQTLLSAVWLMKGPKFQQPPTKNVRNSQVLRQRPFKYGLTRYYGHADEPPVTGIHCQCRPPTPIPDQWPCYSRDARTGSPAVDHHDLIPTICRCVGQYWCTGPVQQATGVLFCFIIDTNIWDKDHMCHAPMLVPSSPPKRL
ncbi:hypothetical protein GWK47_026726 [Chionoecetes opilio]|uniref:Uncharacterized protein n=1 Tax=Chionoecetes opilio TaxID=41210 RepID=A0A8J8WDM9_CHIOP|nr:hypothetical protein GWK47_026726 [Chionoecetes opilio]